MGLDAILVGSDYELLYEENAQEVRQLHQEALAAAAEIEPALRGFRPQPVGGEYSERIGPYSTLHTLRRYAAHLERHGRPPKSSSEDPTNEPELTSIYKGHVETRFPHLINFSDCEGLYVPVDFSRPVLLEEQLPVGSAVALLRELDELRVHLGIAQDHGQRKADDAVVEDEDDPFHAEKWVWMVLHWLAREAVDRHVMILFT